MLRTPKLNLKTLQALANHPSIKRGVLGGVINKFINDVNHNRISILESDLDVITKILNNYLSYPVIQAKDILLKDHRYDNQLIKNYFNLLTNELENNICTLINNVGSDSFASIYKKLEQITVTDNFKKLNTNIVNFFTDPFLKALPAIYSALNRKEMSSTLRVTKGMGNITLPELKNDLLYAIQRYINENYKNKNQAPDQERQNQIGDLVRIISNSRSKDDLLDRMDAYLSINLFFKSELKNHLNNVINVYHSINKVNKTKYKQFDSVISIDISKPLTLTNQKRLNAFLNKYPDQTFFDANYIYEMEGMKFKLSHHFLKRQRKLPMPDGTFITQNKYDLLPAKAFASGSFGMAFHVEKSLTLTGRSLRESSDEEHIVKMTAGFDENKYNIDFDNKFEFSGRAINYPSSVEKLERESKYQQFDNRFRPKPIQVYEDEDTQLQFLTDRKFQGSTLYDAIDILEKDFDSPKRYQLSIALLRALDEQFIQHKVIHRDIKPDNIIVDLNSMQVNIIDTGPAIQFSHKVKSATGTPKFMPPEAFTTDQNGYVKYDATSDLCSMGITLGDVWGNQHPDFMYLANNENNVVGKRAHEKLKYDASGNISAIIKEMASSDISKRDLNQSINQFIKEYLRVKYPKIDDHDSLFNAYNEGMKFRDELRRDKEGRYLSLDYGKQHISAHLNYALAQLKPQDENHIQEFIQGLGWYSLKECISCDELEKKVNDIVVEYEDSLEEYKKLLNDAKYFSENKKVDSENDEELKVLIGEIQLKFNRIKDKKPFDLDYIFQANQNLKKEYDSYRIRLLALTDYSQQYAIGKTFSDALSKVLALSQEDKVRFMTFINHGLPKDSNQNEIAAFAYGLGWNSVRGISNRDELVSTLESILNNKVSRDTIVNESTQTLKTINKLFPKNSFSLVHKMQNLKDLSDLDDIHENVLIKNIDIKNFSKLNDVTVLLFEMQQVLKYSALNPELLKNANRRKLNAEFNQLCADLQGILSINDTSKCLLKLSQLTINFKNSNLGSFLLDFVAKSPELAALIKIKNPSKLHKSNNSNLEDDLLYAMKKYAKEYIQSGEEITKERLEDMKKVYGLTNVSNSYGPNREKELKKSISQISTGLFGRSKLKDKLQDVLEKHQSKKNQSDTHHPRK